MPQSHLKRAWPIVILLVSVIFLAIVVIKTHVDSKQSQAFIFGWGRQGSVKIQEKMTAMNQIHYYEYDLVWEPIESENNISFKQINIKKVSYDYRGDEKKPTLVKQPINQEQDILAFKVSADGRYIDGDNEMHYDEVYRTWLGWYGMWLNAELKDGNIEPNYLSRLAGKNTYQVKEINEVNDHIELKSTNTLKGKKYFSVIDEFLQGTKNKMTFEDILEVYKSFETEGVYEMKTLRPLSVSITKKFNVRTFEDKLFKSRIKREYQFLWDDKKPIALLF